MQETSYIQAQAEARTALDEGNPEAAISLMDPWLSGRNLMPGAVALAARAMLTLGEYRRAAALLASAVEWHRDSPILRKLLGQVYLRQGRIGVGIARLREAFALNTEDAGAIVMAARAAQSIDRPRVALSLSEELLGVRPENIDGRLIRIEALIATNEIEQAREAVAALLEGPIESPHHVGQVASIFIKLEDPGRAADILLKRPYGPDLRRTYVQLVEVLIQASDLDPANAILLKLEAQDHDRTTARLRLRLAEASGAHRDRLTAHKAVGELSGRALPPHPLKRELFTLDIPKPGLIRRERALLAAHTSVRPDEEFESWRPNAVRGVIWSSRVDDWWRAGRPRAEEISDLIEPVVGAQRLISRCAREDGIVVNNHAGPTLASVWWLQNQFAKFHTVGTPSGAPYMVGDDPLELNITTRHKTAFVKGLLKKLADRRVLGITPELGEHLPKHDRTATTMFSQEVSISSLAARLAHAAKVPVFWVQPRWTVAGRIKIEITEMPAPYANEDRKAYVSRWASDFAVRSEAFFKLNPLNASPDNQLWSAISLAEDQEDANFDEVAGRVSDDAGDDERYAELAALEK